MKRLVGHVRVSLVVTLGLLLPALAHAQAPTKTVYVSETELSIQDGDATRVVATFTGKAQEVLVASSGAAALVRFDSGWQWFHLTRGWQHKLSCDRKVVISASGKCVACMTRDGTGALFVVNQKLRRVGKLSGQTFGFGPLDAYVAVGSTAGIQAVTVIGPRKESRTLAPETPVRHFSVAPSGKRAVGIYTSDDGAASLYTFKLDGKGARRRLGQDARPLQWSADGKWLLIETDLAACVVRATGGEYKCWNGYKASGVSASGDAATFIKDGDAYWSPVTGPRSTAPKLLRRNVVAAVPLP